MADTTTLITLLDNMITSSENKKQSGYQTLIYNKFLELAQNNAETADLLGLDAQILADAQAAEAMSDAIESIVTDKVNNALIGGGSGGGSSIDLSNYYKKTETDQRIQQALSNGTQSDWAETNTSLATYIKNKPTKVSAFENDKGYLTAHQSLEAYATKQFVEDLISQGNFDVDLSECVLASQLDSAVATLGYIKTIPANYVTTSQLDAKQYLTAAALTGFVTEEGLAQKGYLTEHQSLENYATKDFLSEYYASKAYVTEAIVDLMAGGEIDLSTYASVLYVDEAIAAVRKDIPEATDLTGYATETWVSEQLANYNPEGVDEDAVKAIVEGYGYLTAVPDTYATKEYVAEQLQGFTPGEGGTSVDLSAYYTSEQIDNKLLEYLLSSTYNKDKHIKMVDNTTELNPVGPDENGLYPTNSYDSYLTRTVYNNMGGNLIFVKPNADTDKLFGLVYISEPKEEFTYESESQEFTDVITNINLDTFEIQYGTVQYVANTTKHIITGQVSIISEQLTLNKEKIDTLYKNIDGTHFVSYKKDDINSAVATIDQIRPELQSVLSNEIYITHDALIKAFNPDNAPIIMLPSEIPNRVNGDSSSQLIWVTNFFDNKQYIIRIWSRYMGMRYVYGDIYQTINPLSQDDLIPYATQAWVTEKIAGAALGGGSGEGGSGVDIEGLLSIYATKDEVNTLGANLRTEIPINMSQLNNDAGYLTSIPQSTLDNYVSYAFFNTIYNPGDPWVTQSSLASIIPAVPTKVSAFENDAKYTSEEFVLTKIAQAALSGSGVDLSLYATKSYVDSKIPTIPTNISAFTNDKQYITESALLSGAKTGYVLCYKGGTFTWENPEGMITGGGSSGSGSTNITFETVDIDFSQLTFV